MLGGGRAGELRITRFIRNPRVTPEAMFASAAARTAGLVKSRHILAVQDTTTRHDDGGQCSLALHPTIAVDAQDGALLGLVHAAFLSCAGGQKATRTTRPFAQKESYRWLVGTQATGGLIAAGAARVTVVADREGDVFETFARRPPGVDLLIRAGQDRCLTDGRMLFEAARDQPPLGRTSIDLPAAPGRRARTVILELRAGQVTLKRPRRPGGQAAGLPASVSLTLVEAREIDPPAGGAPTHWSLLTTHTVESLAEAQTMTGYYRQRWVIEQVFRTCKTKGFNLEAVRIEQQTPFRNLAGATLIAAIQVMQLVRDRDGDAGRPLTDTFQSADLPLLNALSSKLEGNTARQKNPHPSGSLAHASWIMAHLGGWTGYYGKPGPVVMLNGMLRFNAIRKGWHLSRDV